MTDQLVMESNVMEEIHNEENDDNEYIPNNDGNGNGKKNSKSKNKKTNNNQQIVPNQDEEEDIIEDNQVAPDFLPVDRLHEVGINNVDISKLKINGITTIRGVQMTTLKNLSKIKGLSELKIEKMKEGANKLLPNTFISGTDFENKRKSVIRISTGSNEFDKLIGGGIQTLSITEVFGEFRTGKTQLSHTLCVTTQLPINMGGGNGKVAFIDTEGTFRPDRIKTISERFGLNGDTVLNNITYARAFNSEHQMELLNDLAARLAEEKQYRLIIIDSIISLFRTDFNGRGELSERQQKLNQMMAKLLRMSEEFNIAIFITNQMCSDPGAGLTFVSDPKKPIGGHILAHASTTRLYLRKGRGETRIVKIYDSPDVPESEAIYSITEGGINDEN